MCYEFGDMLYEVLKIWINTTLKLFFILNESLIKSIASFFSYRNTELLTILFANFSFKLQLRTNEHIYYLADVHGFCCWC